jgi:hypothetical protein
VLASAAQGALAQGTAAFARYLDREVFRRIDVTGTRSLGFHDHRVEGDREAFNSLNYSGQGGRRFTDIGHLRISGRRVLRVLDFDATILDDRFTDPQGQKWTVDVAQGPWTLRFGDIQGRLLNTNRFLPFDRSLHGLEAGYQSGRLAIRAIQSQARGSARTVTITGTNSPGPYYLQNSQLIPGSERVQVDGQDMRLGQDYVVNYELGSITFVDRAIPLTSTIVVTYEAFGVNARRGVVEGAGMSYDMGSWGRIGVTALQQRARAGGGASTRLERFQGFGSPSTPYFLQFEPLRTAPVTVRADGVIQVPGVDYFFDPDNPAIFFFTRFMPASVTIDVVYTPVPRTTVEGDRRTVGIDYRLPLGPKGRSGEVSVSLARGMLFNTPTPLSGTARGARLAYRSGILDVTANVRDVPEGFVSVESRTFSRNERAYDWQVALRPAGPFRYGVAHDNSAIRSRRVDSDGVARFIGTRAARVRLFAETAQEEAAQRWRLEHQRQASRGFAGESRVDSTSLSTSQRRAGLSWHLSIDRQVGYGPSLRPGERSNFNLVGGRLTAAYNPHSVWSANLTAGLSNVLVDGDRSTGRDLNLGVAWNPSSQWSARAGYVLSDAGTIATLGRFTGGAGLGFDGNGFTGGAGATGTILGAANVEATQFSLMYTPNDRFSANLGWVGQRTTGSVTSNARTSALSLSLAADLGAGHQIAASIDRSATSFVDSPLRSDATTIGFFYSARPRGPWTYALGANMQLSGGTRQFAQDSFWLEGSITHRLGPRHALALTANGGSTRGYLPQDSFEAGLSYIYRIWEALTLNVSYRIRDVRNLDRTLTSGAYRSRGFDVQLNFMLDR